MSGDGVSPGCLSVRARTTEKKEGRTGCDIFCLRIHVLSCGSNGISTTGLWPGASSHYLRQPTRRPRAAEDGWIGHKVA